MIKTLATIKDEYKLSAPKTVTTKRDLTYSKIPETACTIPAGTQLQVHFSDVRHSRIFFEYNDALRAATVENAHKNFTGFHKVPGMKALERMAFDGIAKTCTGKRTEPDGTGPDGSPSWLLVIGVI